ncbi:hypothetical protein VLK31_33730 [Variovorax sp. H27-G14]|uniref:hypothetical protein n=1 Tax=Variovorax sp. H27-G14 TaxID=3111914 RepID=UPI0038FC7772
MKDLGAWNIPLTAGASLIAHAALLLFVFNRWRLTALWVWSSAICLVFGRVHGGVHLLGAVQVWPDL